MSIVDEATATANNAAKGIAGNAASAAAGQVAALVAKDLGDKAGLLAGKLAGQAAGALLGSLFGRADPDIPFSFYVEIDGIRCLKFNEAKGLEWKAETVSFYEGGNYRYKVNLVGPGSFSPLILRKGFFAASGEFYQWMDTVMNPGSRPVSRATVSVVCQNDAGDEVARFNLFGAFITRYHGPEFNGMSSGQIAFEEIEITYDYFEFQPGGAMAGALQAGMAAIGKGLM